MLPKQIANAIRKDLAMILQDFSTSIRFFRWKIVQKFETCIKDFHKFFRSEFVYPLEGFFSVKETHSTSDENDVFEMLSWEGREQLLSSFYCSTKSCLKIYLSLVGFWDHLLIPFLFERQIDPKYIRKERNPLWDLSM